MTVSMFRCDNCRKLMELEYPDDQNVVNCPICGGIAIRQSGHKKSNKKGNQIMQKLTEQSAAYRTLKVFCPRNASNSVWAAVIKFWGGETKYLDWFVDDGRGGTLNQDKIIVGKWLIENGAELDEHVLLDMD